MKKVILFVGIIALSLGGYYTLGSFFSNISWSLFGPSVNVYRGVTQTIQNTFTFLTPKSNLIKENEELKREIKRLNGELLNKETLSYENTISSSTVSFMASSTLETDEIKNSIQATPLLLPPQAPYDTVIIDVGENDGVAAGTRVFLSKNVQIGTIESVFQNKSQVRLFSSPGLKTTGIVSRTGEFLELSGEGGRNFSVELPSTFDIQAGDIISLPGKEHIAIAKVFEIQRNETSSFINAFLSLPLNITGKTTLYVVP